MDSRLVFAVVLLWCVCACAAFPAMQFTADNFSPFFAPAGNGSNTTSCTSKYSCAGDGDDCIGDQIIANGCDPTNGSCCGFGLFCVSGQCAVDNEGATCNATAPCVSSIAASAKQYQCIGSPATCQYLYGPGDDCAASINCLYGLNCSSGVCQGIAVGQTCTAGQCTYGSTCQPTNNSMVCVASLAENAKCPGSNNAQCITGTICFSGTCTELYSLDSGDKCTTGLCGEGLTCAPNGTCVSANDNLVSCTTQSDCNNNLTLCTCSFFTGNSFCLDLTYDPCAGEASDLISCQMDNNCTDLYQSSDSCVYNNCYSDLKKSQSCGCDASDDVFSGCSYNQFCGGFPVWAIIVIIIVAIVLVLAIVLLVFFMMRRRRVYDSI